MATTTSSFIVWEIWRLLVLQVIPWLKEILVLSIFLFCHFYPCWLLCCNGKMFTEGEDKNVLKAQHPRQEGQGKGKGTSPCKAYIFSEERKKNLFQKYLVSFFWQITGSNMVTCLPLSEAWDWPTTTQTKWSSLHKEENSNAAGWINNDICHICSC